MPDRLSPGPRPPHRFRTTVHGTVFAGRDRLLERLEGGDLLRLIPDPPFCESPGVWVHLESGDPVGHLPPEIERWLGPWLQTGGAARARALRVYGRETPSWRRLLVEVRCGGETTASPERPPVT